MSFQSSIRKLLASDGRSRSDLQHDLEDEFAFHLESAAAELVTEGWHRSEADRRAREAFGDVRRIRRECERIGLADRIWLERLRAGAFVALAVSLAVALTLLAQRGARQEEVAALQQEVARLRGELTGGTAGRERADPRARAVLERAAAHYASLEHVRCDLVTQQRVEAVGYVLSGRGRFAATKPDRVAFSARDRLGVYGLVQNADAGQMVLGPLKAYHPYEADASFGAVLDRVRNSPFPMPAMEFPLALLASDPFEALGGAPSGCEYVERTEVGGAAADRVRLADGSELFIAAGEPAWLLKFVASKERATPQHVPAGVMMHVPTFVVECTNWSGESISAATFTVNEPRKMRRVGDLHELVELFSHPAPGTAWRTGVVAEARNAPSGRGGDGGGREAGESQSEREREIGGGS